MSGGSKETQKTNQTSTKDFIPWVKPAAEEYLGGAQQEYRADPAHYTGYFQNLFRPDDGSDPNRLPMNQMGYLGALSGLGDYDRSKPLNKADFGTFATQGPKKARPIAQNLLDEASKLENTTLPWLRSALTQQQSLKGKAAKRQNAKANIASTQKQIDDALARITALRTPQYDPGDIIGGTPMGGFGATDGGAGGLGLNGFDGLGGTKGGFDGGMGGRINDYANTQLIGDSIAPWTKEQQEAMRDTSRIAREHIAGADTNQQLRDYLGGFFTRGGGSTDENPELANVIRRAEADQSRSFANDILPRMNSFFARHNAFGGSNWANANALAERQQMQEQGRIAEDIRYRDWVDRQNRGLQAAGLFGSTGAAADSRYRDLAALSGVGEQRQGYTQRLMDEAYKKYFGERAMSQEDLDRFGNAINMLGSHTGVENTKSKTTTQKSGDTLGAISSGLLSLAGIAGAPFTGGASLALSGMLGGLMGAGGSATGVTNAGQIIRTGPGR